MCGIIGYNGFQDPKEILLDGLNRLEYRGYDSAGIAILQNSRVEVFRCEGRLRSLEEKLRSHKFSGSVGIGHTRWATHGAPTEINAHPHRVGSITLVHNGIIENYRELKDTLVKLGRSIASDTDSEIVAHLFDIEVQNGKPLQDSLPNVLSKLKGSYAFVLLNEKEPEKMFGVRNGAPLLIGVSEKEQFLASDVQAILHRTSRIIYLEDKQFAICSKTKVSVFTENGNSVPLKEKKIHWTAEQMDKAGYEHFMLKEIHEQTRALTNSIEGNINHKKGIIQLAEINKARKVLKKIKRISLVACGTARHAALVGKYYIERFAKIPVDVDFGSEFRYRSPLLEPDTLFVAISQSGETADTLGALREARLLKVPTLSICNVRESSLTRESNFVLYTNAGPEIGVASTKAFTTQLLVLYMFAVELGYLNKSIPEEYACELTQNLLHLPILVEKTLQKAATIEAIAKEYRKKAFYFFLGRGVQYPIALEGALKLKEISYLHAEGYPAGELKHGPIALVDKNTAIIVLAPKDQENEHPESNVQSALSNTLYDKLMSNLQEVKSRGGKIWTIGTEGHEEGGYARDSELFTSVPRTTWALNPILMSIPLQLFAYYAALHCGTDVDKPRNLAKSVTVE